MPAKTANLRREKDRTMCDESRPAREAAPEGTYDPLRDGGLRAGALSNLIEKSQAPTRPWDPERDGGHQMLKEPGRPTIRGIVRARLEKAMHIQRDVEGEARAAETAYKLLEQHPEFGELLDALITLRILRGGPFA